MFNGDLGGAVIHHLHHATVAPVVLASLMCDEPQTGGGSVS